MLYAIAYMAGLFALSSVPDDGSEVSRRVLFAPPQLQNLLHVPLYAGLAWVWWRALRARGMHARRAVLWAASIATAYGVLDEVHQAFVPGRYASVSDALLNAAGAAAVALVVCLRPTTA